MNTIMGSWRGAARFAVLTLLVQAAPTLSAAQVEESFHYTYPVSGNGQFALDNVNGKVRITGWDQAQIQVDGVKRASTQAALDAIKVEIKATDSKVTVHTDLPKGKSSGWRKADSASVDYEIKVPTKASLSSVSSVNGQVEIAGVQGKVEASTVNGRLAAKGLAGDTKLDSVNGAVESSFESLESVKSASFHTVNGKVEVTLPQRPNAQLTANSLNGRIQAGELAVKKNWPVGSELHAKVGDGHARIKAETVNGGIRFNLSGAIEPAGLEKSE
jgi:DUF4097 and DUF4098 domain-containing protein YvlB